MERKAVIDLDNYDFVIRLLEEEPDYVIADEDD